MIKFVCVILLIQLALLLPSGESKRYHRKGNRKGRRRGPKKNYVPTDSEVVGDLRINENQRLQVGEMSEAEKISAVVESSYGEPIECYWEDYGKCVRSRRDDAGCFRRSKICFDNGKTCKWVCVNDPFDSWDYCTTTRSCRDKWGMSRKTESKECSCFEAMNFRRAWLENNPFRNRRG